MTKGVAFFSGTPAPAPPPAPPNLDSYTTSLFAVCGLNQLLSAYTGNLIQVRRDSDNTTTNIGIASGGVLDTTSLLAFVGSGSGYIVTWYDQSGGGNNLAQSTTASQPRIVNAGVYDAAVYFDGVDDGLVCVNDHGAWTGASVYVGGTLRTLGSNRQIIVESDEGTGGASNLLGSIFIDYSPTGSPAGMRNILSSNAAANLIIGSAGTGPAPSNNVIGLVDNFNAGIDSLRVYYYENGAAQSLTYADSNAISSSATLDPSKKWNVGARNGGASLPSTMSMVEIVIYAVAHTATLVGDVSIVLENYV